MRKRTWTLLTIAIALLLVIATPAEAANTAVASSNSTGGDLSNATTLENVTVRGSGTGARVDLAHLYNPADAEGDGDRDQDFWGVGDDDFDSQIESELQIRPDQTGTIDTLTVDVTTPYGSDYGATVDVYIAPEAVDQDPTEGTKVATWDPDWTSGEQTIDISNYAVQAGQDYSVQFVTTNTDNDGTRDALQFAADGTSDGSGDEWVREQEAGSWSSLEQYPDIDVGYLASTEGTYVGQSHTVDDATAGFVDLNMTDAEATVTWQGSNDGGSSWTDITTTTRTSSGNYTASISGYDEYRVNVTFDRTATTGEARLQDGGVLFSNEAPTVDNSSMEPADGTKLESDSVTYSVNITDPAFATAQGDRVNASLYIDGSYRGSDILTNNGTAQVTESGLTGGDHTYYWELTDAYGGSDTSQTNTVTTPSQISIFNETSPDTRVKGTSTEVTIRFFRDGNQTVIERTTTTGNVSLQGLDPAQEYIVVARADGFEDRRVVIESLYRQERIYLLAESQASAEVVFNLDDQTGDFPSESRLFIEKPINGSFQTIAGDSFGASGSYPATLELDRRYRLRIVSPEGETRVLGSYTTTGNAAETLTIGQISFVGSEETGVAYDASLESGPNGSRVIRVSYNDPANQTSSVQVGIQRENGTMLVPNATTTGEFGTFQATYIVPDSAPDDVSYQVIWEVERDGETQSESRVVSGVTDVGRGLGIDDGPLELIGYLAIVGILGLTAIKTPTKAGIPATATAGALTAIGIVQIPALFLAGAGVISLLFAAAGGGA